MLLRLAFRNLFRNTRRTIITMIAVAIGLALLIMGSALGDGAHREMVRTGVSMFAGHVVVQKAGYQEKRDVKLSVPRGDQVARKLKAAFPGAPVLQRIFLQGLLTSTDGSSAAALTAVIPKEEEHVSDLSKKVVKGHYLGTDDTDIVIGQLLAENLGVDLGDKVVLMLQKDGVIESQLFRVRGIFRSGAAEMDGSLATISLPAAQAILKMGKAVTQVSVHLDADTDFAAAVAKAKAAVNDGTLEVLDWMQAMPNIYQFVVVDDAGMWFFLVVIAVIVGFGIMNTVLMSVLERVREFGVMLSLGMTPKKLGWLILLEATALGVLGALFGLVIGLIIAQYLVIHGLDYSSFMGESMDLEGIAISSQIMGYISWSKVALFFVLSIVATIVSALYPVWFVTRLTPVTAMEHR